MSVMSNMTSDELDESKEDLLYLIYLHLEQNGFQKAAKMLKKHVSQKEEPIETTSLQEIYKTWANFRVADLVFKAKQDPVVDSTTLKNPKLDPDIPKDGSDEATPDLALAQAASPTTPSPAAVNTSSVEERGQISEEDNTNNTEKEEAPQEIASMDTAEENVTVASIAQVEAEEKEQKDEQDESLEKDNVVQEELPLKSLETDDSSVAITDTENTPSGDVPTQPASVPENENHEVSSEDKSESSQSVQKTTAEELGSAIAEDLSGPPADSEEAAEATTIVVETNVLDAKDVPENVELETETEPTPTLPKRSKKKTKNNNVEGNEEQKDKSDADPKVDSEDLALPLTGDDTAELDSTPLIESPSHLVLSAKSLKKRRKRAKGTCKVTDESGVSETKGATMVASAPVENADPEAIAVQDSPKAKLGKRGSEQDSKETPKKKKKMSERGVIVTEALTRTSETESQIPAEAEKKKKKKRKRKHKPKTPRCGLGPLEVLESSESKDTTAKQDSAAEEILTNEPQIPEGTNTERKKKKKKRNRKAKISKNESVDTETAVAVEIEHPLELPTEIEPNNINTESVPETKTAGKKKKKQKKNISENKLDESEPTSTPAAVELEQPSEATQKKKDEVKKKKERMRKTSHKASPEIDAVPLETSPDIVDELPPKKKKRSSKNQ